MPTIDELIGCLLVIAAIAGICGAWILFFAVMAG